MYVRIIDERISTFLQSRLRSERLEKVSAVQAAQWLDDARILRDRPARRGAPLRVLLRKGLIRGSVQCPPRPKGRWYIKRIE